MPGARVAVVNDSCERAWVIQFAIELFSSADRSQVGATRPADWERDKAVRIQYRTLLRWIHALDSQRL